MKKIVLLCICLSIFFTSCSLKNRSESITNTESYSEFTYFPVRTYGVYDLYVKNSSDNKFDKMMNENPIDIRMDTEIQNIDISSTRSAQVFFNEYAEAWKNELENSLSNLKNYLTGEDIEALEEAQGSWETSLQLNNQVDLKIMGSNSVNLGTQYVPSSLLYMINEYRERVFHIKYVTMLVEEFVPNQIPENERTWNKFLID